MFEKMKLEVAKGNDPEKKENPICNFCFKRHEPSTCEKLNKFKSELSRTGMIQPEEGKDGDRTQEILSLSSKDDKKFKELVSAMTSYYGMGEYKKEKDSSGNVIERFRGENITVSSLGEKDKNIKINDKPIKLDETLGEYVWRYNAVKENGEIDPVIRINSLSSLSKLRESKERKEGERFQKAA
jgi:hypothetical protein